MMRSTSTKITVLFAFILSFHCYGSDGSEDANTPFSILVTPPDQSTGKSSVPVVWTPTQVIASTHHATQRTQRFPLNIKPKQSQPLVSYPRLSGSNFALSLAPSPSVASMQEPLLPVPTQSSDAAAKSLETKSTMRSRAQQVGKIIFCSDTTTCNVCCFSLNSLSFFICSPCILSYICCNGTCAKKCIHDL